MVGGKYTRMMSHQNAHCVAEVLASGFFSIFQILYFSDIAIILGGKKSFQKIKVTVQRL